MTAREDVRKIEEQIGHPEDDMGARNGGSQLYGSEMELTLRREGFQVDIMAVDSERLFQALSYLRALFPEIKK